MVSFDTHVKSLTLVSLFVRQEHLNYSDEELMPVDVREPVPAAPGRQLPEYNGFGSLEDSAQNCTSLVTINVPRIPPRKL